VIAGPQSRRDALRTLVAGGIAMAVGSASALGAERRQQREILIRGGRVVNADGARDADVRIVGELIADVGPRLALRPGTRVIDAGGRLVLPGGIDPHTHLQGGFADDLTTGSQAALAGGITTVGTFANARSGESLVQAVDRVAQQVSTDAIADVILHAGAWPPTPEVIAAIPALAARGQPSIKVFMVQRDFHAQIAQVIQMLEAARDAGVVTMIHCEDGALLAAAVRRLGDAGRTSLQYYGESRPIVAELAATQLAASLCESTGAPMHVVHLSSARALDACRSARRAGAPLYVETRPLYLHLTDERFTGPEAPLFVGQPPLRSRADSEALWAGLADESIDVLATDHAPWTRAQKMDPSLTISRVRPGVSDLQFMLPMFFSEGVVKRRLPPERFVAVTSTNAARIFGLYPRKGVIQPQAMADVVIWDPSLIGRVRAENDHSRSDYSVYEGWQVSGWPVVTIRRGEVVVEGGRVTGVPGGGTLVSRSPHAPSIRR
jgi:dihydropyrimidinase